MANTGTTWTQAVDDVGKILKQNLDDAEVNPNAILFWLVTGASRLRRSRFQNQLKATGTIEGDYLAIYCARPAGDGDAEKTQKSRRR